VSLLLSDPEDHIQRIVRVSNRFYEQDLLEEIAGRAWPGEVIDVGAHIGNHTLWFAGIMGRPVTAFEPNLLSATRLYANLRMNGLEDDVTVWEEAVWDSPGYVDVHEGRPGNSGTSYCTGSWVGARRITLDSLRLENIAVIKIDVEGSQMKVLEGAKHLIENCRPLLYVEVATEDERMELLNWMGERNYQFLGQWAKTPVHGYCPVERLP
jgi:FkbM family methyltransferase